MALPGWVGVREPWGPLGGRYAKNVTICPSPRRATTPGDTPGCSTTPYHHIYTKYRAVPHSCQPRAVLYCTHLCMVSKIAVEFYTTESFHFLAGRVREHGAAWSLDHLSVYKFKQNVKGKERNIPLTTTHELPYPRGVELRGSHARIPSHGPRLIPRVGACSLRAARSRVGGRLATRERATARTAPALLPRCPNGTVHSPTHAPTQARERRPRKSASLASSRRRRWLRGSYS